VTIANISHCDIFWTGKMIVMENVECTLHSVHYYKTEMQKNELRKGRYDN
jgi:hypothetical protein